MKKIIISLLLTFVVVGVFLYLYNLRPRPTTRASLERDKYGCMKDFFDYSFDAETGACVRAVEMTPGIKKAIKVVMSKLDKKFGISIIQVNSYEEPGAYDIKYENGVDGKWITAYLKNWQVVSSTTSN